MVICHNKNCKYCKGNICSIDTKFTVLNGFAQCKIWWFNNGTPRQEPFYPIAETEVNGGNEPANPQEKAED